VNFDRHIWACWLIFSAHVSQVQRPSSKVTVHGRGKKSCYSSESVRCRARADDRRACISYIRRQALLLPPPGVNASHCAVMSASHKQFSFSLTFRAHSKPITVDSLSPFAVICRLNNADPFKQRVTFLAEQSPYGRPRVISCRKIRSHRRH